MTSHGTASRLLEVREPAVQDAGTRALGVLESAQSIRIPLRITQIKLVLAAGDLLLLNAALLVQLLYGSVRPGPERLEPVWFVSLSLLWLMIGSASRSYTPRRLIGGIASAMGAAKLVVVTGGIFLLLPWAPALTVRDAFGVVGIAIALVGIWRFTFAHLVSAPIFQRRVLIVGAGEAGRSLARAIQEEDPTSQLVGYIDDDEHKQGQTFSGVRVVGTRTDLPRIVQSDPTVDIVLAITHRMHPELIEAALRCFESGGRVMSLPQAYEKATGRIPVEHIGERWLLTLPITRERQGFFAATKRLIDIGISLVGLAVFLPLLPLLALAVKLDSPGPVFYRPERLGRGGKPFRLWKLRTMVANADAIGDPTFTSRNDSRITRLGNFLRRTHLDELPQLINILWGQMSVVGPRPERYVPEFEKQIPYYRLRYAVKPGAAGWALINQGYAEGAGATQVKLQYDLYYIKYQSLYLDLVILARTLRDMMTLGGR